MLELAAAPPSHRPTLPLPTPNPGRKTPTIKDQDHKAATAAVVLEREAAEQTVVLHRAPLGSHERFVAFLIEHFAGAFPVWLAPVQARVVPISDRQADGAASIWRRLVDAGIRAELDDSDNTMQAKIRRSEQQKVPYVAVVGDRELENDSVSVRARGRRNLGSRPVTEVIEKLRQLIADRAMTLDLDPES